MAGPSFARDFFLLVVIASYVISPTLQQEATDDYGSAPKNTTVDNNKDSQPSATEIEIDNYGTVTKAFDDWTTEGLAESTTDPNLLVSVKDVFKDHFDSGDKGIGIIQDWLKEEKLTTRFEDDRTTQQSLNEEVVEKIHKIVDEVYSEAFKNNTVDETTRDASISEEGISELAAASTASYLFDDLHNVATENSFTLKEQFAEDKTFISEKETNNNTVTISSSDMIETTDSAFETNTKFNELGNSQFPSSTSELNISNIYRTESILGHTTEMTLEYEVETSQIPLHDLETSKSSSTVSVDTSPIISELSTASTMSYLLEDLQTIATENSFTVKEQFAEDKTFISDKETFTEQEVEASTSKLLKNGTELNASSYIDETTSELSIGSTPKESSNDEMEEAKTSYFSVKNNSELSTENAILKEPTEAVSEFNSIKTLENEIEANSSQIFVEEIFDFTTESVQLYNALTTQNDIEATTSLVLEENSDLQPVDTEIINISTENSETIGVRSTTERVPVSTQDLSSEIPFISGSEESLTKAITMMTESNQMAFNKTGEVTEETFLPTDVFQISTQESEEYRNKSSSNDIDTKPIEEIDIDLVKNSGTMIPSSIVTSTEDSSNNLSSTNILVEISTENINSMFDSTEASTSATKENSIIDLQDYFESNILVTENVNILNVEGSNSTENINSFHMTVTPTLPLHPTSEDYITTETVVNINAEGDLSTQITTNNQEIENEPTEVTDLDSFSKPNVDGSSEVTKTPTQTQTYSNLFTSSTGNSSSFSDEIQMTETHEFVDVPSTINTELIITKQDEIIENSTLTTTMKDLIMTTNIQEEEKDVSSIEASTTEQSEAELNGDSTESTGIVMPITEEQDTEAVFKESASNAITGHNTVFVLEELEASSTTMQPLDVQIGQIPNDRTISELSQTTNEDDPPQSSTIRNEDYKENENKSFINEENELNELANEELKLGITNTQSLNDLHTDGSLDMAEVFLVPTHDETIKDSEADSSQFTEDAKPTLSAADLVIGAMEILTNNRETTTTQSLVDLQTDDSPFIVEALPALIQNTDNHISSLISQKEEAEKTEITAAKIKEPEDIVVNPTLSSMIDLTIGEFEINNQEGTITELVLEDNDVDSSSSRRETTTTQSLVDFQTDYSPFIIDSKDADISSWISQEEEAEKTEATAAKIQEHEDIVVNPTVSSMIDFKIEELEINNQEGITTELVLEDNAVDSSSSPLETTTTQSLVDFQTDNSPFNTEVLPALIQNADNDRKDTDTSSWINQEEEAEKTEATEDKNQEPEDIVVNPTVSSMIDFKLEELEINNQEGTTEFVLEDNDVDSSSSPRESTTTQSLVDFQTDNSPFNAEVLPALIQNADNDRKETDISSWIRQEKEAGKTEANEDRNQEPEDVIVNPTVASMIDFKIEELEINNQEGITTELVLEDTDVDSYLPPNERQTEYIQIMTTESLDSISNSSSTITEELEKLENVENGTTIESYTTMNDVVEISNIDPFSLIKEDKKEDARDKIIDYVLDTEEESVQNIINPEIFTPNLPEKKINNEEVTPVLLSDDPTDTVPLTYENKESEVDSSVPVNNEELIKTNDDKTVVDTVTNDEVDDEVRVGKMVEISDLVQSSTEFLPHVEFTTEVYGNAVYTEVETTTVDSFDYNSKLNLKDLTTSAPSFANGMNFFRKFIAAETSKQAEPAESITEKENLDEENNPETTTTLSGLNTESSILLKKISMVNNGRPRVVQITTEPITTSGGLFNNPFSQFKLWLMGSSTTEATLIVENDDKKVEVNVDLTEIPYEVEVSTNTIDENIMLPLTSTTERLFHVMDYAKREEDNVNEIVKVNVSDEISLQKETTTESSTTISSVDNLTTQNVQDKSTSTTTQSYTTFKNSIEDILENSIDDDVVDVLDGTKEFNKIVTDVNQFFDGENGIQSAIFDFISSVESTETSVTASIPDDKGKFCAAISLDVDIKINETKFGVPANASVISNCSMEQQHINITWRSTNGDGSNNSVYFVLKSSQYDAYVEYMQLVLMSNATGLVMKSRNDLHMSSTKRPNGSRHINGSIDFGSGITMRFLYSYMDLFDHKEIEPVSADTFVFIMASSSVFVVVIVAVISLFMFKRYRNGRRVFKVSEK